MEEVPYNSLVNHIHKQIEDFLQKTIVNCEHGSQGTVLRIHASLHRTHSPETTIPVLGEPLLVRYPRGRP
jgi:hypothetical protein